jgi:hypothetical protein
MPPLHPIQSAIEEPLLELAGLNQAVAIFALGIEAEGDREAGEGLYQIAAECRNKIAIIKEIVALGGVNPEEDEE